MIRAFRRDLWILALGTSIGLGCDSSMAPSEEGPSISLLPGTGFEGRLAFVQLTRQGPENNITGVALFVADGANGDVRRIRWWRSDRAYIEGITWDPDGQSLTYGFGIHSDAPASEPFWRLRRIDADGTNERDATNRDANVREGYPVWSPTGKLTSLFDGTHEGERRWFEIFVDGAPFFDCQIPDAPYDSPCESTRPAWSPDGQYLVVSMADETTQGALYRLTVADGTIVPLRQGQGAYNTEIFRAPVYSPDGSRIAFVRQAGIQWEIWVMASDGSDPRQVTSGHLDRQPAWSPDGHRLAFTRIASSQETREQTGVWVLGGPMLDEPIHITDSPADLLVWQ